MSKKEYEELCKTYNLNEGELDKLINLINSLVEIVIEKNNF